MHRAHVVVIALMLTACRTDTDKVDTGELADTCTWYADADGDGYGDADAHAEGPCTGVSEGYVDNDDDCDDDDASIHPGQDELCDGLDNDCDGEIDEDATDGSAWYADVDGDGYGDAETSTVACEAPEGFVQDATDCDDQDGSIHPAAAERCDGLDNDCDGEIDEDLNELWYADADSDGYGDPDVTLESCDPDPGWVADASDCDDANSAINPAADEECDAIDNDCDGLIDDADPDVTGTSTWYQDADGDGYGVEGSTTAACHAPSGYAAYGGDCDDSDAAYHPGAAEEDCTDPNDYNCDGSTGYADDDGDGFAACEDCDDSDASVNPDATERCNGVDDDCDGDIDEDDATDTITWYADADGDGYGDAASTTLACDEPSGFTDDDSDCDDSDGGIHPAAAELCDGIDNDCDGLVDDDDASVSGGATWYVDADADGFGNASYGTTACDQPAGYVADNTDCRDGDASAFPGGVELCDGVDNDCDGSVDESAADAATWYADADGDGHGDGGVSTSACTAPSGYVSDAADCDDGDAAVHPEAVELCDGIDNDCDGLADEDDPDLADAGTWYADSDGDGYGDADSAVQACSAPSGYVSDDADCDDSDGAISPAAVEYCDGLDNDCDGAIDEDDAADTATWYADADGDGYGDGSVTTSACAQPSGHVADSSDCDDDNNTVYPGASELCEGLDNDCDGSIDEGALLTWYADADGDGFGDAGVTTEACTPPAGYGGDANDCDDADGAVNPAADEYCNGIDDDCDGRVDENDALDAGTWYLDYDSDGYGGTSYTTTACAQPSGYVSLADATDCNDFSAGDHPGADEYCDGADNDCDGDVDEEGALDPATWYLDVDGDGYGVDTDTLEGCDPISGYAAEPYDCDDSDATFNPSADDFCDGLDQDCDGIADDDHHAGKFLLTVDTNHGYSYAIDASTAGSTAVAALDSGYGINSVAVDDAGVGYGNDYTTNSLVSIDACTGAISTIGAMGVGNTCGISFGPSGLLYGLDTTHDQLVEIDPTTGAATVVGPLGTTVANCGMAYDCANDLLYAATAAGNTIFKIDPATGAAYDIVSTAVPFASVGLEHDPATGLLYASTGTELYHVDPADGATTFIGPVGGTNADDLVHYPECE
jgi:hypothetical protein